MDQDVPLGLTMDEVKTLDLVRMRLSQLTHSMQSLAQSVYASNPLPDPATLQSFQNVLQKNLESVNQVLTENSDLFSRVAVHPSTNFDKRHEHVLLMLLRKKLETPAEIWAEDGRVAAVESLPPPTSHGATGTGTGTLMTAKEKGEDEHRRMEAHWDEQEKLGETIKSAFFEILGEYIQSEEPSVFTKEEKESGQPLESVRTGLRRDLVKEERDMFGDDDEEEGDEETQNDEDQQMGGTGVMPDQQQRAPVPVPLQYQGEMMASGRLSSTEISPEQLFWFGIRGDFDMPPTVEKISDRAAGRSSRKGGAGAGGSAASGPPQPPAGLPGQGGPAPGRFGGSGLPGNIRQGGPGQPPAPGNPAGFVGPGMGRGF